MEVGVGQRREWLAKRAENGLVHEYLSTDACMLPLWTTVFAGTIHILKTYPNLKARLVCRSGQ